MVEWTDDAVVLSARRQGETSLLVSLLTRERGRHLGLVRGGARGRDRSAVEPGAEVIARWKARLPEHLGQLAVELRTQHAGRLLDEPARLAALASATALLDASLPERQANGRLYQALLHLLQSLAGTADWGCDYVRWEMALLEELGYGLDLSSCAVTGVTAPLRFVSPRTGRAVSAEAGAPYAERLLRLPAFLIPTETGEVQEAAATAPPAELAHGLALTGHFIERHLFEGRRPPDARERLLTRLVPDSFPRGVGLR